MSITGEPGGPPVKAGVPLTDLAAGLFALTGILAALEARHRTGAGQQVDTSLVEAGVALSVWEATEFFSGSGMPRPLGSAHRMNAPYQAVQCADGYITVGGANDRTFTRLCRVLDHPEWTSMPEFADNASRVRHQVALADRIEAITRTKPRSHWLAEFTANNIPCGPINDYGDVFADPQILSRRMVLETDHPTLGRLKTLGSPLKLSATPTNPGRRAPLLGEHTREILHTAGLGDDEVEELYRTGAVG
jgi:formyl-CoA transferase